MIGGFNSTPYIALSLKIGAGEGSSLTVKLVREKRCEIAIKHAGLDRKMQY